MEDYLKIQEAIKKIGEDDPDFAERLKRRVSAPVSKTEEIVQESKKSGIEKSLPVGDRD